MIKTLVFAVFLILVLAIALLSNLSSALGRGVDIVLNRPRVVSFRAPEKPESRALYSIGRGSELKPIDERIGSGRFSRGEYDLGSPGRTYFLSSAGSGANTSGRPRRTSKKTASKSTSTGPWESRLVNTRSDIGSSLFSKWKRTSGVGGRGGG